MNKAEGCSGKAAAEIYHRELCFHLLATTEFTELSDHFSTHLHGTEY